MEKFYRGVPGSRRIAVGSAFVIHNIKVIIPRYSIDKDVESINQEIDKLEEALLATKNQLEKLKTDVFLQQSTIESGYLDSTMLMLDDPTIKQRVQEKIQESYLNIEWVFNEVIEEMAGKLQRSEVHYFRERAPDVLSMGRRVLNNLLGNGERESSDQSKNSIVIAHTLSPPEVVYFANHKIKAIVTEIGGRTSHVAIMAQDLKIPAVIGVEHITNSVESGQKVIVDGNTGSVIVNPEKDTLRLYRFKEREQQTVESNLSKLQNRPCLLKNGVPIELLANMDLEEELELVHQCGCTGIGLFRTEYIYLNRGGVPDEETQLSIYRNVIESVKPNSVTIRTIDIGGDKKPPYLDYIEETNPFLGLRGIRFALRHDEMLRVQIRAILRAAAFGNARIMFPMVNDLDEMKQVMALMKRCKEELSQEELPHDSSIQIGIMVETPSSVILLDTFSTSVDFISVGTNDLIQYTLAIDRGNGMVADKFDPLHPAIVRTLKHIIDSAQRRGLETSICGEMAGDPLYTLLLIGLGFRILSMSTMNIPTVKSIVINSSLDETIEIAEKVLGLSSTEEIRTYVRDEMIGRFKYLEDYFRTA
jgi:phosphotransferase system enzyme I (PtsI)